METNLRKLFLCHRFGEVEKGVTHTSVLTEHYIIYSIYTPLKMFIFSHEPKDL